MWLVAVVGDSSGLDNTLLGRGLERKKKSLRGRGFRSWGKVRILKERRWRCCELSGKGTELLWGK